MMVSPEHEFVRAESLSAAADLARSEIFGYSEAERGRFDFACLLTQHKERAVIGQTLRSHAAGIDKDLSSLLQDQADSLPVYLHSFTPKHISRIGEFVNSARHRLSDRVQLLRLIPYPMFDANVANDRETVCNHFRERVLDDIFAERRFGRLAAIDVALYLEERGPASHVTVRRGRARV